MEGLEQDPTFNQAMERLTAGESRLAATTTPEATDDSATAPPTAPADAETTETQPPETKPDDTPATTETPTEPKPEGTEPKVDPKRDPKSGKFAKDFERRVGSWKELNSRKEEHAKLEADLKRQVDEFQRQKVAFEKQQADAKKANVKTPEYYEQGAVALEKAADDAANRSDFDKADELRAMARLSKQQAADLRANPPKPDPTAEQAEKAFGDEQEKWGKKAAIDFPALQNKDGKLSPAMELLKAMTTPGSDKFDPIVAEAVKTSPAGLYYAGRLANAETVAARVPTLEKDLADARAEVKKLNGKLSVNGNGLATVQPSKPDARNVPLGNLGDELRAQASQVRLSDLR